MHDTFWVIQVLIFNLQQFISSLPSEHVLYPLHREEEEIHWPLVHWNWLEVQPALIPRNLKTHIISGGISATAINQDVNWLYDKWQNFNFAMFWQHFECLHQAFTTNVHHSKLFFELKLTFSLQLVSLSCVAMPNEDQVLLKCCKIYYLKPRSHISVVLVQKCDSQGSLL